MTKFLDDIEAAIQNIHIEHGVNNTDVTRLVAEAIKAGLSPLQSEVTGLQGQVAELQKALQDTVVAINNGDIEAAEATASAASKTVDNPANGDVDGAGNNTGADTGGTENHQAENGNGVPGTAGN